MWAYHVFTMMSLSHIHLLALSHVLVQVKQYTTLTNFKNYSPNF